VSRVRVLIADDHPVFRAGLRMLVEREDDMECVAEAGTAQEAVDSALALKPDVAVIDLRMPERSGIWATRRIAAELPGVAVLLLTMHEDRESVMAAMDAGARGYAVKGADEDDIIRAIRSVGRGDAIFAPVVAGYIADAFAGAPSSAARAFPDLTDREREILEQLADGASNGQIAQRLGLSPKTIRNHMASICNKLQVVDRAQAALKARDAGLGRSSPV
jgi:DNA-binding NarL/FixJ family response regulator